MSARYYITIGIDSPDLDRGAENYPSMFPRRDPDEWTPTDLRRALDFLNQADRSDYWISEVRTEPLAAGGGG